MTDETLLMRYHGGPWDGQTAIIVRGHPFYGWPLPGSVRVTTPYPDGTYRRTGMSQLTEAVPGVARGAEYQWHSVRNDAPETLDTVTLV